MTMNLLELGKGFLFLLGGVLFFIFFNRLLSRNSPTDEIIDVKGFIGGVAIILCGCGIIYNELARYFGWALLFVDK